MSEVAQSCPTLCDPMDCNPPGSSVHGILQARILEWVAISFSRGSSQPRDRTRVSRIVGRRFILNYSVNNVGKDDPVLLFPGRLQLLVGGGRWSMLKKPLMMLFM